MSTSASRTVRIPDESRLIFIPSFDRNRTIRIPQENRIVFIERKTTSADRTVYATED